MKNLLRFILFAAGCAVIWLGLNVSLGGIKTLGWQGAEGFIAITDVETFNVQDNHMRFIAGVWTALGFLLILGSIALDQMRGVLVACIIMIFFGGLSRFSGQDLSVLFGQDIAPSLVAELILFPMLGFWIYQATAKQPFKNDQI